MQKGSILSLHKKLMEVKTAAYHASKEVVVDEDNEKWDALVLSLNHSLDIVNDLYIHKGKAVQR